MGRLSRRQGTRNRGTVDAPETLPTEWLVYCGKATERLLHLSAAMGKKPLAQTCVHWERLPAFPVGYLIRQGKAIKSTPCVRNF